MYCYEIAKWDCKMDFFPMNVQLTEASEESLNYLAEDFSPKNYL